MIELLNTDIAYSTMLGSSRLVNIACFTEWIFTIHDLIILVFSFDFLSLLLMLDNTRVNSACLVETVIADEHDDGASVHMISTKIWSWKIFHHTLFDVHDKTTTSYNEIKDLHQGIRLVDCIIYGTDTFISDIVPKTRSNNHFKSIKPWLLLFSFWFFLLFGNSIFSILIKISFSRIMCLLFLGKHSCCIHAQESKDGNIKHVVL